MTLPVLFLGHGSPMNAIDDNAFHRGWRDAAAALPKPRAILCVSAHWETPGVAVTASPQPPIIHDFYGFPQALFDVRYPAPGDPALAARVAALFAPEPVTLDPHRGLDHGAWGVLIAMYPDADIPVVQLSLDVSKSAAEHAALAAKLAPLRDEGVLILGSGDIVHNLRQFNFRDPRPLDWAERFNAVAKAHITAGEHAALADIEALGPDAALAINSAEHYLPLLYVLALQRAGETVTFFNDEVVGSISMTSVKIG